MRPTVRLRTRQINALAPLAASGLGVAVVPRSAVPPAFTGAVRGCDPPLGREVVALRRSDADPVAGRFVELLCRLGVPDPLPHGAGAGDV
ncbi:MAG: hypothetical protein CMH83_04440 [Nocardioides sp.]|nr:hypothetical protein [Nocardioides sp.]